MWGTPFEERLSAAAQLVHDGAEQLHEAARGRRRRTPPRAPPRVCPPLLRPPYHVGVIHRLVPRRGSAVPSQAPPALKAHTSLGRTRLRPPLSSRRTRLSPTCPLGALVSGPPALRAHVSRGVLVEGHTSGARNMPFALSKKQAAPARGAISRIPGAFYCFAPGVLYYHLYPLYFDCSRCVTLSVTCPRYYKSRVRISLNIFIGFVKLNIFVDFLS